MTIPLPFAAITPAHAEFTKDLPPVAKDILYCLYQRRKTTVAQEFDKQVYDTYCLNTGRKTVSDKWYRVCMSKLFNCRLVEKVHRYSNRFGCGFKAIAYHPWELDDWTLDTTKSTNTTSERNKNAKKRNESSANVYSNIDSSVDLYRESRENTAIVNGSTGVDATPKMQDFIAAKKKEHSISEDVASESSPAHKSKIKPEKPILRPIPHADGLTARNEDFKADSEPNTRVSPRGKLSRPGEVDVFDNFLDCLDDLGIRVNQTVERYLVKYIKRGLKSQIETALGLFRSRKRDRVIAEPAAYFIQLLKEDLGEKKAIRDVSSDIDQQENQSDFNHWLELAKEVGCCDGYEIIDGKIIVNMKGTKELWQSVFNRGYNFEYFKGILKKK